MNVPLNVPFSLLGYQHKSHLLSLLRREIAAFATPTAQHRIRARSINIFPLIFNLPPNNSTLVNCLTAASLDTSQHSLKDLSAIVAQRFAQYKQSIPPSIDQQASKCSLGVQPPCLLRTPHIGRLENFKMLSGTT